VPGGWFVILRHAQHLNVREREPAHHPTHRSAPVAPWCGSHDMDYVPFLKKTKRKNKRYTEISVQSSFSEHSLKSMKCKTVQLRHPVKKGHFC
jgi:hypothetical protein